MGKTRKIKKMKAIDRNLCLDKYKNDEQYELGEQPPRSGNSRYKRYLMACKNQKITITEIWQIFSI